MSTTLPADNRTHVPADHRGAPATGVRPPVYGSDDAPVLLQLPNLAPSSNPTASEVTAPTDELAPNETPGSPASPGSPGSEEQQLNDEPRQRSANDSQPVRQQRRRQFRRGPSPASRSSSWIGNIGQYIFAVVIACSIFTVFVMWKERQQDNRATEAASPPPVTLPAWDDHPAVVLPEAGDSDPDSVWGTSPATSGTGLTPPATTAADASVAERRASDNTSAPGLGVPDLRLARQPEQAGSAAPANPSYPDTGVPPLQSDALSKQRLEADRWGERGGTRAARQAQRPPTTDQRSR